MTQWGLDTLFNPAKRHMDEEKRRLQSTREEVGDNSGGKRIDLESGKVSIKRVDPEDERDGEGDENAAAPASGKAKGARDAKASGDGPSPAAIRAAQRRGRTPR